MKIVVDYARCTGLGICEAFAPENFEVDDNGDLVVLNNTVDAARLDAVQQAVEGCPTEALRLES